MLGMGILHEVAWYENALKLSVLSPTSNAPFRALIEVQLLLVVCTKMFPTIETAI